MYRHFLCKDILVRIKIIFLHYEYSFIFLISLHAILFYKSTLTFFFLITCFCPFLSYKYAVKTVFLYDTCLLRRGSYRNKIKISRKETLDAFKRISSMHQRTYSFYILHFVVPARNIYFSEFLVKKTHTICLLIAKCTLLYHVSHYIGINPPNQYVYTRYFYKTSFGCIAIMGVYTYFLSIFIYVLSYVGV